MVGAAVASAAVLLNPYVRKISDIIVGMLAIALPVREILKKP